MPRDVTMPQLGMAQDAGKIVSWLKAPGEAVAKGDPLFEVETDKATMEVEAQASGFLTGVTAAEGEDVPVGAVIARISESAEGDGAEAEGPEAEGAGDGPASASAPADEAPNGAEAALPEGRAVTMPQLGMAQDTGLLVSWQVAPGAEVAAGDILFEVETDKSTMEVEAAAAGFLAATLAQPGEEVPVGAVVAILSDTAPATPLTRSAAQGQAQGQAKAASASTPAPAKAPAETPAASTSAPASAPAKAPTSASTSAPAGRILASPKARRIALEDGLDLARLVAAGHPQPFHMRDLEVLRALPPEPAATAPAAAGQVAAAALRLEARTATDGFAPFAAWAAEAHGLEDADAILAGLAGGGTGTTTIAVERFGRTRLFTVPPGRRLSAVTEVTPEDAGDATPDLVLRDLRGTRLTSVAMGAEAAPVLTLMSRGPGPEEGLALTLEAAPGHLDPAAAIRLLSDVAGRMEQPLRHLL